MPLFDFTFKEVGNWIICYKDGIKQFKMRNSNQNKKFIKDYQHQIVLEWCKGLRKAN